MDWLERMNRALDYIEENLDEEIEYKNLHKWQIVRNIIFPECFHLLPG